MRKRDRMGMQRKAPFKGRMRLTVEIIARHRAADGRHVHTDLVRAARIQLYGKKRPAILGAQHPVIRPCRLPVRRNLAPDALPFPDRKDNAAQFPVRHAVCDGKTIADAVEIMLFTYNPADVNRDGTVDSADIVAVIKEMPDGDKKADVNGDGVIDSADIVAVIKAMK